MVSAQDVAAREHDMVKRLESLTKLEREIERVKECHQSECSQFKENIDKNLRLIENLRQDKLSIQFDLNNVKKEYSGFRKKTEEDLAKREEQIRGMEQKSLDDEINVHSLLKEKELIISRLQASLDKLKTIFFEISSALSVTGNLDIPESVKSAVILMLNDLKCIKDELAQAREEAKGYQSKVNVFVEHLRGSFLPQKTPNDLNLIAELLTNREQVIYIIMRMCCRNWRIKLMNGLKWQRQSIN